MQKNIALIKTKCYYLFRFIAFNLSFRKGEKKWKY